MKQIHCNCSTGFRGNKRVPPTSPLPRISEERDSASGQSPKSSPAKKLKRSSDQGDANLAKYQSGQSNPAAERGNLGNIGAKDAIEALEVVRRNSASMSRSERAALREQTKLLLAQIGSESEPESPEQQRSQKQPEPNQQDEEDISPVVSLLDKVEEPRSIIRTRSAVSRERSQNPLSPDGS